MSNQQIGMSQSEIDAIELRLVGADHRPWKLNRHILDDTGRPLVMKGSGKAYRKAEWSSLTWSGDKKVDALDDPYHRSQINSHHATSGKTISPTEERLGPAPDVDVRTMISKLALFKLCSEASDDMGDFVAHAPEDIERLLTEVKFLRKRYRDCEQEREEFRKEMLAARVEKASLQEKLAETRASLRAFAKLLKDA